MERKYIGITTLSLIGLLALTQYEGFSDKAYLDIAKVPTIGYGSTKEVKIGDKIDEKGARSRLLKEVKDEYGVALNKCIKVPLNQSEYDAYISLSYNIGTTAFCKSTLVKKLNKQKYEEACKEILRWNRVKGEIVKGLIIRRQKEYKMCMEK